MFFTEDADTKEYEIEKFTDGILKKLVTICNNKIESNGMSYKWIVGNKISIADFALASLVFNIMKNENGPFYAASQELLLRNSFFGAYTKRLGNELSSHLSKRE